ncbi:zinc-binding dehydrogenase [Methylosinus sp. Ce-a6]|uniref:quinone oxidoreductase family protein n=1 Tax=Methylosinus sp. Ce-a6 TaxID=2172005 RepID=UPI001359AE14|nr:zinc-binding dehydrogenase [Methylosinus sp. Ce-a6]
MRAVQLNAFGGPEALELVDAPIPTVGPGEILIRVKASGVNFAETAMRENRYAVTPPLPSILGAEAAGIIEAIGPGVAGFALGDRVAGALFAAGRFFGGYAEFVSCPAEFVTQIPKSFPFEHAVALMVQGLTALYLLEQAPAADKQIIVSAAAGGVGSLLVQLAKRAGAKKVIAAASMEDKREFTRSLGADATIDYTVADWSQAARDLTDGRGVDIIFESVGGAVTKESLKALAPLGRLVIYGSLNILDFDLGVPDLLGLIFQNQTITGFALTPLLTPTGLQQSSAKLFAMAERGEIAVTIGGVYPLAQAAAAHRALESRQTRGKIVLTP